jgi:hypothetical protein
MGQVQNFVEEQEKVDWNALGVFEGDADMPFSDEPETTGSELVAVEAVKPSIAYIPPTEVPDLDDMNEGMNIAPQYWEAHNKGETKRGVLIGWSTLNGQNGPVPLAVFQNKEGIWTCAGTNLVQQVRNLSIGTPLQATYEGEEKTNKGFKVNKFTVLLLNAKPVPVIPGVPPGIPAMKSKQPA